MYSLRGSYVLEFFLAESAAVAWVARHMVEHVLVFVAQWYQIWQPHCDYKTSGCCEGCCLPR